MVEGSHRRLGRAGGRRAAGRRAGRPRRPRGPARASSTPTPTSSSPATGPRSSPRGWPASPTPPAASARRSPPPAPPPTSSSPATSPASSRRCAARARRRSRSRAATASPSTTRRAASPSPGSSPRRRRSSAPTSCPTEHRRPEAYVDAGHRPDARGVRTARPLGRRVLRARCVRRRPGARRPQRRSRGRPAWAAARQPARPRARRTAGGELGLTAVDHCTYLTDDDVDALRDAGTIATLLPGVEFSHPLALPGRPPPARRRCHGRAGHRLQPGLVLHHLDAAVRRAGGARDGDDPGRGGVGGDRDRGCRARTATTSACSPPAGGPTSSCSTRRPTSTSPIAPAYRSSPAPGSAAESSDRCPPTPV